MKKIMIVAVSLAMTFAMATMSFGVQLSPEAANTLKTSEKGNFVTNVQEGKISYSKMNTAFLPVEMDKILKAYGLSLHNDMAGNLPKSYAKVSDNNVSFSPLGTAFTPVEYNAIFEAYGLKLDAACIMSTIGRIPYAKRVSSKGEVTLGKRPTAYTGQEYADILACYKLASKPMVQEAKPHTAWVVASDYLFDFDKAVIKKKYYGQLDKVAEKLKSDPTLKVEIQGHTDSTGPTKYNMALSKRRANAVRDYLIKRGGIAPERLTVMAFGETKPIAPNTTREGRAKNRRVELKPMM